MKKKNIKKNEKGYVVLMSMLIVGAIGLTITVSVLLLSLGSSLNSFSMENSARARLLANACAEEALQQIWDDDSYTGSDSLSLTQGICSYDVSSSAVPKTIFVSGTVGTVTRKLDIEIDEVNPVLNISSWQEASN